MKNQLLWAMLLGAGTCVVTGCATNDAATADADEGALTTEEGSEEVAAHWTDDDSREASDYLEGYKEVGTPEARAAAEQAEREAAEAAAEAQAAAEQAAQDAADEMADAESEVVMIEEVEMDEPAEPEPVAVEPTPAAEEMMMADPAMMEMMELAQMAGRTEHHEHMDHFVGTWDVKMTMWPPQGGEQTLMGRSTVTPMLDGLLFLENFVSDYDETFGMQIEGIAISGHDNLEDEYFFYWFENGSPLVSTGRGECDGTGRVFTYYMTQSLPKTGDREYKMVTTIVSDRMHVMESFLKEGREWVESWEMVYTRR